MGWTRQNHLLDLSSSTLSSAPIFIGDSQALAISIVTQGGASTVTLRGSLANGFQSAIPDVTWSVLTLLPAQGMYTLAPGVRWLLAERASASSTTVILARQRWD